MPIAFGQGFDALMENTFEKAHFDRAIDGLLFGVAAQPAYLRRETEKALHRHVRVGGRIFRQITNQALARESGFSSMSNPAQR